ncbi:hypothetical protein [Xanthomonas sp. 3058]|nr:hypothetical protein [Xanthomonas sp. 3058]MBB5862780.1 hypothetical protein [Xanthomonas sp. 3058]
MANRQQRVAERAVGALGGVSRNLDGGMPSQPTDYEVAVGVAGAWSISV